MASNAFFDIFRVKELRQRIFYTFMWLALFRLGDFPAHPRHQRRAPCSPISPTQSSSGAGGITDYLDFFAGGAFKNFSLFMLGVMPYISMQIIMQLLVVVSPTLKKISEEDGGKKKIARWTRIGTVFVTIVESYSITVWADRIPNAITMARLPYSLIAILTVTTGSMFLIWIGEQITKRGIGNGVSLLIFAGIVARLPNALYELIHEDQARRAQPHLRDSRLAMFMAGRRHGRHEQQGQRKIPVNYAKRVVGRRMYGAQNTYIPFKINPSGVIPGHLRELDSHLSARRYRASLGVNMKWLRDFSYWLSPSGFWYSIPVRGLHHFLRVLLHAGHAESAADIQEHPRERRLDPGHPQREDGGAPYAGSSTGSSFPARSTWASSPSFPAWSRTCSASRARWPTSWEGHRS